MAALANLTGQSIGSVLTSTQVPIFLDNGSSCDFTVRQGVIGGMSNGTALTGSGGHIVPSTFDETTETKNPDNQAPTSGDAHGSEGVAQNIVRFDGAALKVNHANGDTVLYICVITSAGDIVGKFVS
jgi:hypothetical protein